jgi:NADPH:quinone reductase-like Zn-dependent oxidoreductase
MSLKRIQYLRYGGPEEMRLETYELPPPGKDEILVRVKASSVNPVDWKIRQGAMKFMTGRRFPRAMGTDFSGVVEQVGATVTRFRAGDEVFGTVPVKPSGAFAQALITKEKLAVKKPASISHEAAATLPVAGVTAWRGLVQKGRLKPGQRVFVNGAYGGVGQAVVQIAKAMDASAAGRVGPSALVDARAMGMDPVLDYSQPIPASLNQKFDIVFDCNGSLTPSDGDALIHRGGLVLDINPTGVKFARSLYSRRRKILFGTQDAEILQHIADLAGGGKLSISIGRRATLEDAIAVIGELEAGRRAKGKTVIVMA